MVSCDACVSHVMHGHVMHGVSHVMHGHVMHGHVMHGHVMHGHVMHGHVMHGVSRVTLEHCPQQVAAAADVLPSERVLRLAQRIQNTPQSRHSDPEDRGVDLQEILHRGRK